MKKILASLFSLALLAGVAPALLAKTGVLIRENDGSTIFISSDDLNSVEFLDDYEETVDPPVVNPPVSDSQWTVAKALSEMNSGYEGPAVVKGVISKIQEVSTSYGNATYFIKDDLNDSADLEIYRGYYLNGDKFTSENQLKVGATVVVSGELVNYYGTFEFTTGSKLLSYEIPSNSAGSDPNVSVPAAFSGQELGYVIIPDDIPAQYKAYTGFTVCFNKDNHTSNYVSWELLASETTGSANRNNYDFKVDSSVEGCPTKDYAYSTTGYQRGHLCPAADQKWSEDAMRDCMYMTNIVPQYSSLNEKIWSTLENNERKWAARDGAIWIVAGPIYSDDDQTRIGASGVRVPSSYFKAFLYNDADNPRAIAFVFVNGSNPGNLQDYAMSIDDLEEILGYDLFPYLPDDIEQKVESTFSFADWNK